MLWEPQHLTTLWAFTACYRDSLPFLFAQCLNKFSYVLFPSQMLSHFIKTLVKSEGVWNRMVRKNLFGWKSGCCSPFNSFFAPQRFVNWFCWLLHAHDKVSNSPSLGLLAGLVSSPSVSPWFHTLSLQLKKEYEPVSLTLWFDSKNKIVTISDVQNISQKETSCAITNLPRWWTTKCKSCTQLKLRTRSAGSEQETWNFIKHFIASPVKSHLWNWPPNNITVSLLLMYPTVRMRWVGRNCELIILQLKFKDYTSLLGEQPKATSSRRSHPT
jgi:hypothetical protein